MGHCPAHLTDKEHCPFPDVGELPPPYAHRRQHMHTLGTSASPPSETLPEGGTNSVAI